MRRLGVDTGGTFTDFVLLEDGALRVHKRFSTPGDPARAVLAGIESLAGSSGGLEVVHGTTVATNALLERRGARTALVATAGFGDVIEIGRQNRPDLYALHPTRPPALVPSHLRFEVRERVDAAGAVIEPLSDEEIERVCGRVVESGAEAVAVCLLFSFLYPAHERRLGDALRRRGLGVSLSVEVAPEFREYERTSTTAVNAYLSPVMGGYLDRLAVAPAAGRLDVMQSSGGRCNASVAARRPVLTVLSGPAAGVIGAVTVAAAAGYAEIITFDMGGTSTDVSLCSGAPEPAAERHIAGLPLRVPSLAIHTIGAGGGSIAALDAGGALMVGPQSAGAMPGPAAYGLGGKEPTVSDANVVLGRLLPGRFLGGSVELHTKLAEAAIASLGLSARARNAAASKVLEPAAAIVAVANSNMERALRVISVERGHDPRRFPLVAFGGCGPLHACALAEALQMPRVLVPRYPGLLCALGALAADAVLEVSQTVMVRLDPGSDEASRSGVATSLTETVDSLHRRLLDLSAGDPAFRQPRLIAEADARYGGQSYELRVPLGTAKAAAAAFEAAHERRYGRRFAGRAVEIVNVRLRAVGRTEPLPLVPEPLEGASPSAAFIGSAGICIPQGTRRQIIQVEAAIYDRERLRPGNVIAGPALVTQLDCTTYVAPAWQGRVDAYGNLLLER